MRVVRFYHGSRDPAHRQRNVALASAGVDVTLVVPAVWPDGGSERQLTPDPSYEVIELPVRRAGDVNRHAYADPGELRRVIAASGSSLIDIQEEPFSSVTRQVLTTADGKPCVSYTAQNVDKRFPPPFLQYERAALSTLAGIYPCSWQAASVVRGKGYSGPIDVLPLGYDDATYFPGEQEAGDGELVLGLVGRLVPEKGVIDAVDVLAEVRRTRLARLVVVGSGPEEAPARRRAAELGIRDAVTFDPWQPLDQIAALYRTMHVVLLPSVATTTWTEQFGRVIVEAQASGCLLAGYASGTIPEVAGEAGLLVPEGDVAALSQAVIALIADPADWERRRRLGLANAAGMTWSQVGRRQAAFYDRALASRATARVGSLSPTRQRAAARAEFGPTATLRGGIARPFALPLLRKDNAATRALAALVDLPSRLR